MEMENWITRAASMIAFRVSVDEIRAKLKESGASEEQAYLAYCAAKLL